MASSLESVLNAADKMNPDAEILSESPLSLVDEWIDTGCYALNAIVSGSCFGGLPKGRIIGFTGPSGCGKTLMMNKVIGNFQRESEDHWAFVFDSELAEDPVSAASVGADPTRIKHIPVNTVNETRNQILAILDQIIEQEMEGNFIMVIDSLGNLAGTKELADAEAGKDATDMGTRAKNIKSMLRTITYRAARAKTTILFSNHIYNDPTAMYPSAVKHQSGGEGPIYMASVLVQLGFKREKNEKDHEKDVILGAAKKVGGITMHALTAKNRFIPPMLETDIYLNFKTGLDKYSGLFELAKGLGIITGAKTYELNGEKIGYRKDFERNPEFWEKTGLPILEAKIVEEFSFSSDNLFETEEEV
jgi:RecA/RadA recombinase